MLLMQHVAACYQAFGLSHNNTTRQACAWDVKLSVDKAWASGPSPTCMTILVHYAKSWQKQVLLICPVRASTSKAHRADSAHTRFCVLEMLPGDVHLLQRAT